MPLRFLPRTRHDSALRRSPAGKEERVQASAIQWKRRASKQGQLYTRLRTQDRFDCLSGRDMCV